MSTNHKSPADFQNWVLAQYRASPTQQYYELIPQPTTEACKIGLGRDLPPRPFVAVHKCQGGAVSPPAPKRMSALSGRGRWAAA